MSTRPPIEHETIRTNGVDLHVAFAGPETGDPVVLLHGFPEFWYGWRHQLGPLADAGYRLVVPDQRGYNRSEKPDGVDAYAIDELAGDAVGLLDALGHDTARFVGHDWGAAVTWHTALAHPERIERAVTMNVPHPAVFQGFFASHPSQLAKSWYMFVFQLPRLPELVFGADDYRWLERVFPGTSNREEAFTEADLERYREAWSRPGALTGMLNWYRALFRADAEAPPTMTVEPETLLVWGARDAYLHRDMAELSVEHCADGRLELFEDATHWVQHERVDRVNESLLAFL